MNSANADNLNATSSSGKVDKTTIAKGLQFSSSFFAVAGGTLLASNTEVSKYGFILLALSDAYIFFTFFQVEAVVR